MRDKIDWDYLKAQAKAQVTKVENVINKYIESQRCNLFFNEETDEDLIKAREKLATKNNNLRDVLTV